MRENIIWWVVLILTTISFLLIPGLVQMLWEELKKIKEDENE